MKRILSMINPSSAKGLHIGNYFGMAKPAIEMQSQGECLYAIANIHALNTVFDPREVNENTIHIFAEMIALGINVEKTVFFVESDVPGIPYLQTILNNVVTIAELKRMHAYKDKMTQSADHDSISMGLFSYPVLMSADILLFDTDVVPVGEDQTQHVEICREIARSFNNRYGNVLKIPELSVKKETARVIGTDGARKMSKSLGNDIPIFAPEETIKKQIMAIKTDPARIHPSDPGDPAKNVTFSYLELIDYDQSRINDMKERYKKGTIGDVEIKKLLFEQIMRYFLPFRIKKAELLKHPDTLVDLRRQGAKKANAVAEKKLQQILLSIGL